ncbi:MAG: ArsA family ATPase [Candidatus Dormibacteria bacterium]
MRVLLYTGKGGVGKTTVAAATAVRCARLGYRTLIISTDAAHSLGDSLDIELSDRPTEIEKNLWAQEVNALHALEDHWDKIHQYLTALFASQDVDEIVAEELASPPGMEEVASLMWIKHHQQSGAYDVLVVDCAPTGETLQLLAFPDVARWYLQKIFPIERKVMRVARPVLQRAIGVPMPSDEIFGSVMELLLDLEGMKKILGDPKVCTVRIVLNLEKMVVKEAQRALTYLSLYDYLCDLVVVNRVLPPEVTDGYFDTWRRSQERYSALVDAAFSPIPILRTRLFEHEIVGLDRLAAMADSIYEGLDPTRILYAEVPQKLRKRGDQYHLTLRLPFVEKADLELTHREGELFISLGPYKREIALPRVLNGKVTQGAKLEEGQLSVVFGTPR